MKFKNGWVLIPGVIYLLFFAGCDSQIQLHDATSPGEPNLSDGLLIPNITSMSRLTETHPPSPLPTSEANELQAFFLEMLSSNGGCELPCWWGIMPGETKWEEMGEFFVTQGISGWENGYLDLSYIDPDENRRIRLLEVKMEQRDGLVQKILVTRDYFNQPSQDDFARNWGRYELAQVLSRHGVPSQVYLSLAIGEACIGPGIVPVYDMWVEYENLGMAILYPGMLIRNLDNWLVCPVFGQTSQVFGPTRGLEIRLQSQSLDDPIVVMEPGDGEFVITGTLMELANITMNEFYDEFRKPVPQACALIANIQRSYPVYDEIVLAPISSRMTAGEEDAFLVDMLSKNGSCELPCWWGITPGVTDWQDAQQLFLTHGKNIGIQQYFAGYRDEDGKYIESYAGVAHEVSLFGRHAQYPFDYVLEHTFFEQGDAVQLIEVIGHALGGDTWYTSGWSAPIYFSQDWHRYNPDQILNRFGEPSQVLLHYWPEENTLYSLALLYEDEGMMIAYMGPVQGEYKEEDAYQLDTVNICPTIDQIIDINIWLKSPELKDTLEQIYNNWRRGEGYYVLPFSENRSPTLEEAAGMSLQQFYSTYRDPNTQVCIQAQGILADQFP